MSKRLALPVVNDIGYPCPGSIDSWATKVGPRFVTLEIEDNLSLREMRKKYGLQLMLSYSIMLEQSNTK